MNTIDALTESLKVAGLSALVLQASGGGRAVVCPELGAKLLGAGVDDENLLWVPQTLTPGQWCVGGQRTWLAPELGPRGWFGAEESQWRVPPELDPGSYRALDRRAAPPTAVPSAAAARSGGSCAFRAHMSLVRADASEVRVALERQISLLSGGSPGPVRSLTIRVRQTLVNRGGRRLGREAGLWAILQVPSERDGTILAPLRRKAPLQSGTGSSLSPARLYFGQLPRGWLRGSAGLQGSKPGLLCVRALAGARYKLGLSAADTAGVVAFLRPSRVNRTLWTLVVQRCAVERAGHYLDRPPQELEGPGDVLQCYNHGDSALPFSELECHAPARVLAPRGRQRATVDYLFAKGPQNAVLAAAERAIGRTVDSGLLFA
ncbi:MAG: hypothetical protein JW820_14520 [Spirochaetales bacterium]|nr:hypothetical protein [Spirochaetales bacterium]